MNLRTLRFLATIHGFSLARWARWLIAYTRLRRQSQFNA